MESKKIEKLFFAGECLDIDGVTGGFNFQSAWTTARLAAKEISKQILIHGIVIICFLKKQINGLKLFDHTDHISGLHLKYITETLLLQL